MRKILYLLLIALSFGIFGCAKSYELPESSKDATFYTQFSFFYEGDTHRTTNYRKGVLVPVNTAVKINEIYFETITVTLIESGQVIKLLNVENFSKATTQQIFERTFKTTPVDLGKYSADKAKLIKNGEYEEGMTKDEVLLSLGYPPAHQTPSLSSTQWRYWQNRFNTFILRFDENGIVEKIIN